MAVFDSNLVARVISMAILVYASSGCSRKYYRTDADQEAACLIQEKGGTSADRIVYAPPESRLADPLSIDCPPLPPDDPSSHALMHCVDGKSGSDGWHRFGSTPLVESPTWQYSLLQNADGDIVVDLREAVRLSRLHSRTYQTNIETLYRSALGVSFQRFRFDHQFFGSAEVRSEFQGRDNGQNSGLALGRLGNAPTTAARVEKLTATGGELAIGFANSLMWDFWGDNTDVFSSAIDFSLVQPLLRGGGRAIVLENLTQAERNLLANVRQLQQFQQGFFVDIITGRNSGPGPSLQNGVGSNGLGIIAGSPGGRSGAPSAGGFIGLLEDQQEIRNQASNISALRSSLAQLEAAFDANRISSRLQVDQARQALLNAQSSLLIDKAAYQTRTDAFKVELGLPPELPIEIEDPLLERFVLIDPELTELQDDVESVLSQFREMRDEPVADEIAKLEADVQALTPAIEKQLTEAKAELESLNLLLPQRKKQLARVSETIQELDADIDPRVYDQDRLGKSFVELGRRLPEISERFELLYDAFDISPDERAKLELLGRFLWKDDTTDLKKSWGSSLRIVTALSDTLLELSLVQAEIRLQGISLQPTKIDTQEAVQFARLNRLDWMNARANLVDQWRQVEITANDLESDLDIRVDGRLGTEPDNIFEFDGDNSRLRMGIEFDTPTARLAERNAYRVALIDYQAARREYMLFEDRVSQSLRNTLRMLTLTEINLEVRRAAVKVAIAQVDIARLKLNPPLKPGQPNRSSPTAARDLVSALSDLLDAQNDFLNVWVANEVLRILLDFEMGTMQLDPTGVWIDSGNTGEIQTTQSGDERRLEPPADSGSADSGSADTASDFADASPSVTPVPKEAEIGSIDFYQLLNDPQNQVEIVKIRSDSPLQAH